jgi:phospholipase/carboxylesterase
VALVLSQGSCRPSEKAVSHEKVTVGRWGGLDTRMVTAMAEGERGGRVLVILHGYGGTPERLMGGARTLAARHRMRIFLPAAPLPQGSGRAWWTFDRPDWPKHAWGNEQDDTLKASSELQSSRAAMKALLTEVRAQFQPELLMLAGHSQGAMLAMDLALIGDPPVDRVVVRSGALLTASLPQLRSQHAKRSAVFISHGRQDGTIEFWKAERLKVMLEEHGHDVIWRPTEDGHGLPSRDDFEDIARFLSQ